MRRALAMLLVIGLALACSSGSDAGGGTLDVSADCSKVCAAAAQQCGWSAGDQSACSQGCANDYKGLSNACSSQASAAFACANQGSAWDCSSGEPTACSAQVDALEECQKAHSGSVPGGLGPYCDKCAECVADQTFNEGFCDPFATGGNFDTAACAQNGNPADIDNKNLTAAQLSQMSCADFDNAI